MRHATCPRGAPAFAFADALGKAHIPKFQAFTKKEPMCKEVRDRVQNARLTYEAGCRQRNEVPCVVAGSGLCLDWMGCRVYSHKCMQGFGCGAHVRAHATAIGSTDALW